MDPLRAMTFNVRVDTDADGADAWANRRDLVASTIRFHGPDVVGLQEPLPRQVDDLDARLPGYDWVGRSRKAAERAGEYAPVLFRTDRFALADHGTFWLSETPDDPGSVGWDASHPRVATWARLRDERGDRPLVVCNAHLDHRGERARREGAALIAERVRDLAAESTVLVTGDLNCQPGDSPYGRIEGTELGDGRRLIDAVAAADHRHGPATSRTDFHDLIDDRRIDHVFVADDCRVRRAAALTDRDQQRYPSDHLPVLAEVE